MSIFNNNILAGAAAQSSGSAVHTIDQSIRFNALDNPYMSKAFSSKGSPKKFTLSWWTKLSERTLEVTSESQMFFIAYHSGGYQTDFSIQSSARASGVSHTFRTYSTTTSGAAVWNLATTQLFRDGSAWYNFVVVSDTDNAIQSERFRLYINGQRVTDFGTATYPSSGVEPVWNNSTSVTHYVGSRAANVNTRFDGYMAEMVHIDGQALDPSSFGETNSSGLWVPIDVSGLTFGTNGFHIDGRDSADLGDDESGQGNDFSTSGLAAHDQMADSPTNNFCVMNSGNTHSSMTLSNGNLQSTASAHTGSGATILLPSTGKWYCEFRYNSGLNNEYPVVGVYNTIKNLSTTAVNPGLTSGDLDIGFGVDGRRNEDNTKTTSWMNTIANGNIGAIAIDTENKKIWFGHNNSGSFVWQASGNPSAGTNEANTKDFADDLIFGNSHYGGTNLTWNFGQDGTFAGTETAQGNADGNGVGNFYYAPPTGFLALCTKNIGAD